MKAAGVVGWRHPGVVQSRAKASRPDGSAACFGDPRVADHQDRRARRRDENDDTRALAKVKPRRDILRIVFEHIPSLIANLRLNLPIRT